ncbi:hypothetical protein BXZ70DRAFT_672347 [Cristinia sonorae]|uniref:Uncharacterized protein n=1 Tax=Cristinia sonorae TaxID=1940300 RepID=A0A8K0XSQ4_9AGAR|nr:hypothetical protein BXZ70DRAFT_672347 [Cristinia sonorae]
MSIRQFSATGSGVAYLEAQPSVSFGEPGSAISCHRHLPDDAQRWEDIFERSLSRSNFFKRNLKTFPRLLDFRGCSPITHGEPSRNPCLGFLSRPAMCLKTSETSGCETRAHSGSHAQQVVWHRLLNGIAALVKPILGVAKVLTSISVDSSHLVRPMSVRFVFESCSSCDHLGASRTLLSMLDMGWGCLDGFFEGRQTWTRLRLLRALSRLRSIAVATHSNRLPGSPFPVRGHWAASGWDKTLYLSFIASSELLSRSAPDGPKYGRE